ncbi:glycosyl transferase family 1 [Methylovorus sp. MM2]|uniref:glycosyltransferase n=1 Tax=Methylovorus sp. MM2 TaxID=1848038 RepID=UPI0007DF5AC0|nr:glycosyltransferase [Methylovorus sp. MM2]OAM51213.1 glycosyl transferase family 1 [Methylovorus sp. MM2]
MSNIVLLSTADWDNPFWTNKQHVACELERSGYKVFYIDSLGLRRPSVSSQDLRRILVRLKKALRAPRQVRENLWVWSPLVIPFQRYAAVRAINRYLLTAGLRFWMWRLKFSPDIFWTYNPMTLSFFNLKKFGKVIYHCVDEIKAQPGMPVDQIESAENALVRAVDDCFVTAEYLLETRKAMNPRTFYFSNVADFAHFSKAREANTAIPDDMKNIASPVIGFVGAISGYKINFELLQSMAMRHPEWSIVMIGKVGEGDPWTDISTLTRLPNIHFVGPREYQDLPAYLKAFDVGILPSMLNEYTRSMFPMKFFEYLAAGLPVVATDLHALANYRHVATLAKSNDEFIEGVEKVLRGEVIPLEERLEIAMEQTYERRTKKMMDIVLGPHQGGTENASV